MLKMLSTESCYGFSYPVVVAYKLVAYKKVGISRHIPANVYLFKTNNRKTKKNEWNLFKIKNKDKRTT